ncbi:MAG: zinc ribbon domain-containing protein [Eubacteriales bacterium]|nr:zinc ribbon domain-containing protein [Eubacteriales bacterium]
MYCRKCGNLLDDTDQNCRKCGEPTKIQMPDESAEPIERNDSPKNSEFVWDVHDFTKLKNTEDIRFNWRLEDYSEPNINEDAEKMLEETLFQEIKDNFKKSSESKIDRFYTFNKRNEEFQELLDKEYERLKGNQSEETLDDTYKETLQDFADAVDETKMAAPAAEEEAEPAASTDEAMKTQTSDSETIEMPAPETVHQVQSLKAGHLDEMAAARAVFFADGAIQNSGSKKKKKKNKSSESKQELGQKMEEEQNIEAKEISAAQLTEHYNGSEAFAVKEDAMTAETAETAALGADANSEKTTAADAETNETEICKDARPATAEDIIEEAPETIEEALPPIPTSHEEENIEKTTDKRTRLGRVILIIIALILAVEIAILGIRYFAPNSAIAKSINNVQSQVIGTVAGWINSDDDIEPASGESPEATDVNGKEDDTDIELPENIMKPDPEPMSDKTALIASQMGNNKNIINVRKNETLAYQAGKDYGLSDINHSKPIENNIWKAPEGKDPVYYDQSIVGTLIAFDSQWIDYVNGGSNRVLNLLKKDSKAYRNAVNFSKVSKVKETFQLLEIGDIRKGSKGYYAWTYEEIQITENGKTNDLKYHWIYHLEPVDGEMKIVNYIKYQNY